MYSYEDVKTWVKENKQQLVIAICFVLVFIVGFGAGRFERGMRREKIKPQANYTTQSTNKPLTQVPVKNAANAEAGQTTPVVAGTSTTDCLIKGNISTAGKKIYHVKGGAFYNIVKPEQCFKTEKEAVDAGFVKSSR